MVSLAHKEAESAKNGSGVIRVLVMAVIVIGLIIVIIRLVISAHVSLRDTKRLSDIRQIQDALQLYFLDQDKYPLNNAPQDIGGKCLDNSPAGFTDVCGKIIYMKVAPLAPFPRNEGACAFGNNFYNQGYTYLAVPAEYSYAIRYCLAKGTAGVSAGLHWATPKSIADP